MTAVSAWRSSSEAHCASAMLKELSALRAVIERRDWRSASSTTGCVSRASDALKAKDVEWLSVWCSGPEPARAMETSSIEEKAA